MVSCGTKIDSPTAEQIMAQECMQHFTEEGRVLLTIHVTLVPLLPYISSLCECTFHSSIAKSPLLTFPTSTSIHLVFSKQPSQIQVPGFYSWEIAPRPAFGSPWIRCAWHQNLLLGPRFLGSTLSPCSLAKNPMETPRMPRKMTAERQRRILKFYFIVV